MEAKTQGPVLRSPAQPGRHGVYRGDAGAWQEGEAGGNFCVSRGHVTAASRKEMVFAPVQNSRTAVGRVIFKKTGDGMEKQTKVGRENREDT